MTSMLLGFQLFGETRLQSGQVSWVNLAGEIVLNMGN
jgi:hypothetical protein